MYLNNEPQIDLCGRRGGLMVSVLDSGSNGPGSGPGQGHCVVFLGQRNAGGNPAKDWHPSRFIPQKPG